MSSPSLHTSRFVSGIAIAALVILVGPLLRIASPQTFLGQGTTGSCPFGMPLCRDMGCRSDGASCRSPRNCCDDDGNITQKLYCCNANFQCSDNYICISGSGQGPPGPPSPPEGGPGGGIAGDGTNILCTSNADCRDSEPCTIDLCLSGTCSHEPDFTDTDSDGTPDCVDQCPSDPQKTEPQQCGCNKEEKSPCEEPGTSPPAPSPAPAPSPSPAPSSSPSSPSPSSPTPSVLASSRPSTIPIADDCSKCTNVRDVCTNSQKLTFIHHSKTLCACFDPGVYQEGWLLCLWKDQPPPSFVSSRPLPPPPPLLQPRPAPSATVSSSSSLFVLPTICGDGIAQSPDEECDDGNKNSYAPNACRPYCQKAWCGDGIIDDLTEDCDAGAVCIGGLLDGPQCVGFGCVRGDPNCISPEACEKGGGTCDFVGDSTCTLYCTKRQTAAPSSASSAPVSPNLIDFFQKSCQRCGDGFFNVCDKTECESFGPCSYQGVLGDLLGTCTVVR